MGNVARKVVLPLSLITVAFLSAAIAVAALPPSISLKLDGLLPLPVADEGPVTRWITFLVPAIMLLVWLGLRAAATTAGARVGNLLVRNVPNDVTSPAVFERFASTYAIIIAAVLVLLLGAHVTILAAAFERQEVAVRAIPVGMGIFMLIVGNVAPRMRPNWVAGVRTTRTLSDPQTWRTTHWAFGLASILGGLVTIVTTMVAPSYGLSVGIALLLVASTVALVASRRGPARMAAES
jgi:uncharacterized membrane protein